MNGLYGGKCSYLQEDLGYEFREIKDSDNAQRWPGGDEFRESIEYLSDDAEYNSDSDSSEDSHYIHASEDEQDTLAEVIESITNPIERDRLLVRVCKIGFRHSFIHLLLEKKAYVGYQNSFRNTALYYAIAHYTPHILHLLMHKMKNSLYQRMLTRSITCSNSENTLYLLEKGGDHCIPFIPFILMAIVHEQTEVAKWLMDRSTKEGLVEYVMEYIAYLHGTDADEDELLRIKELDLHAYLIKRSRTSYIPETYIDYVFSTPGDYLTNMLVKKGIRHDIALSDGNLLSNAIKWGRVETTKSLIKAGANVLATYHEFIVLSEINNLDIIMELVASGIPVNDPENDMLRHISNRMSSIRQQQLSTRQEQTLIENHIDFVHTLIWTYGAFPKKDMGINPDILNIYKQWTFTRVILGMSCNSNIPLRRYTRNRLYERRLIKYISDFFM
jgi:hypothetical protein